MSLPVCSSDGRLSQVSALNYTSPMFAQDTTIAGLVSGDIFAKTTRADGALVITLSDVAPDGTAHELNTGWLRLRHRALDPAGNVTDSKGKVIRPDHPMTRDAAQPVTPGATEEYLVEMNPTAAVIAAGHRVRVTIRGGDAGTLPSAYQAADQTGGLLTVLSGPGQSSSVLLPIVGKPFGVPLLLP